MLLLCLYFSRLICDIRIHVRSISPYIVYSIFSVIYVQCIAILYCSLKVPIPHWISCFNNSYILNVNNDLYISVLFHLNSFFLTLLNHFAWLTYKWMYGSHLIFYFISNFNVQNVSNDLFIGPILLVYIICMDHSGRWLALIANRNQYFIVLMYWLEIQFSYLYSYSW